MAHAANADLQYSITPSTNQSLSSSSSNEITVMSEPVPLTDLYEGDAHFSLAHKCILECTGNYLSAKQLVQRTGWTRAMCEALTLNRVSRVDAEDCMVSSGVIDVVDSKYDDAVIFRNAKVERTSRTGVDVFHIMIRRCRKMEKKIAAGDPLPPGVDVTLTPTNNADNAIHDAGANLFSNKLRPHRLSVDNTLAVPEISDAEDLAWYGFALHRTERPVRLSSPARFIPILPLHVGRNYVRNVRGGLFIEQHGGTRGSIHLWSPLSNDCGGFVLAARKISSAPLRMRFAAIRIPRSYMLVCTSYAWHCDATLKGTFLSSFGFSLGARSTEDDNVVTLQPLKNVKGGPLMVNSIATASKKNNITSGCGQPVSSWMKKLYLL